MYVYELGCHSKLIEYSFKRVVVKVPFTPTFFEILLFKGRLVLSTAQMVTRSERFTPKKSEEVIPATAYLSDIFFVKLMVPTRKINGPLPLNKRVSII